MVDLTFVAIIFVVLIVGYVLSGAIDARLQLKHADTHESLGAAVDSRPLNRDSILHFFRWWRFLTYEHFRLQDRLLSVLCGCSLVLGCLTFSWMLGFL